MLEHMNLIIKILIAFILGYNFNTNKISNKSFATSTTHHPNHATITSLIKELELENDLQFNNLHNASKDFGNRYHHPPVAILNPKSVSNISNLMHQIFQMGPTSGLTVAPRGHGHSLEGQAQAHQGVVINMKSLAKFQEMHFHINNEKTKTPFVDVSGGTLWINILRESLKHGFAPKSWTDYLHLTVGGTLSNGGISGQAFRHGPQINNVYQLEVVTGTGQVVTCTDKINSDLFYGVLGGLGQFGIITQAQIALEPAPEMVKWIRVLYSDFTTFTQDQELLISSNHSFDYVEGFVLINRTGLLNNWRSSFRNKDPVQANWFVSEGKTIFCLEIAKYYKQEDADTIDRILKAYYQN